MDWREVADAESRWIVTDPDDTVWTFKTFPRVRRNTTNVLTYDIAQPIQARRRDGNTLDFTYGSAGELLSVTDIYGRQLQFEWVVRPVQANTVAFAITKISLPDGGKIEYSYDGGGATAPDAPPARLIGVRSLSAGGAQVDATTYVYADPRFLFGVTNVQNAVGANVLGVTYDDRARALTSTLAGGAEKSAVDYSDVDATGVLSRVVTNSLGKKSIYRYQSLAFRLQGMVGEASANCPSSATAVTYDSNGFVLSETDEEGRLTTYTRDAATGQPLTITRGSGAPEAVTTTLTWHPTLNVPTQIAEPGLTTDIVWTDGKVSSLTQTDTTSHSVPYPTNGETRTWSFTYLNNLLRSVDGPLAGTSDRTFYTHGADGYLRRVANPLGQFTTVTSVNGRGQPTAMTDPNGVATAITYDALGHVTSITTDQGGGAPSVTSFTYDVNWNVASMARPGGTVLTFAYDNASRLTSVTNAAGESVVYTRDRLGGATRIEVKRGTTVAAERDQAFDELGRLIRTIGADTAKTWAFGYDRTDNLLSVKDPREETWSSGFDALNRLVSEIAPGAETTALARDGRDEIVGHTDPRNLTTAYVRNGFGDVIRETSPDTGVTDYLYDARGLMTQMTDAGGVVTTWAYDVAGRMTQKTYPAQAGENVAVTWDGTAGGNRGVGRVTRVQDQAGASDFTYDARGNVLSETRTISSASYTTSYTYDLTDRLTSMTYPSGRIVTYIRDGMGRVTSVTTRANAAAPMVTLASSIVWRPMAGTNAASAPPALPDLQMGVAARNAWPVTDGAGMNAGTAAQISALPGTEALTADVLQSLTHGNGFVLFMNFNQDNELYQSIVETASVTVMNRGLARADRTNVTGVTDALEPAETQNFGYSPTGRLASASGAYGTRAWTYDKVGNRTGETANGVATTWAYPANSNRLATVKQGATTLRTLTHSDRSDMSQDVRGGSTYAYVMRRAGPLGSVSLGGVNQSTLIYDAFRRLRVRTLSAATPAPGTTHVVWDIFGHIVAEHVPGSGLSREYVWLGDMPLATVDATSSPAKLFHVHVDHLDRPALMTDSARNVVWKASYEPFGAVRSIIGSASLGLRFPGQWFQLESGLAYNWNRHYDPTLGRYVQPDPLGFVDGPSLYGFGGQTPLMKVDPTGFASTSTPRGNQAQNRQFRNICRELRLNRDQQQQLHREISKQNLGYQEIRAIAIDLFK